MIRMPYLSKANQTVIVRRRVTDRGDDPSCTDTGGTLLQCAGGRNFT